MIQRWSLLSMVKPWGNCIRPAPNDLMKLPLPSNCIIGASLLPVQLLAAQRSTTQILPLLSPRTALEAPMARPAGILKKSGSGA